MTAHSPSAMHRVEHTPDIDLTPWDHLDFNTHIRNEVTRVIKQVFEDTPPELSFAIRHGADDDGHSTTDTPHPVDDPLLIYVELPLSAVELEDCVYALSLESVIDDLIELYEHNKSGRIDDPEGRIVARSIAKALRGLADKLELACGGD